MSALDEVLNRVVIPPMARVRQIFPDDGIRDVEGAVAQTVRACPAYAGIAPGMTVAITAGSRGVANIARVLKVVADMVRARGATPFLVPAMGSHGGGTAQGQLDVLRELGVTDAICPIKSDMAVTRVGSVGDEPVYVDRNAAQADGIILVGRVKSHSAFRGAYESGLMKMMAIGLGKREGAASCHKLGWKHMHARVPAFGMEVLKNANILFGLALVENERDQTFHAEAVMPDDIPAREPELKKLATARMPRIYLPEADVLVVDFIGKEMSGDGADPNVTGKFPTIYASGGLVSQNMCVLDVTDKSHGSVMGIGVAQATTERLVKKIDPVATNLNAVTSCMLNSVRIPPAFPSDRAAIAACIETATEIDHNDARIIRIKNTQELSEIWVSRALIDQVTAHPHMEVLDAPTPWPFDQAGNLW